MKALLKKCQTRNFAFISGDMHYGDLSYEDNPGAPQGIWDITSSGLTHFETKRTNHNRKQNFVGRNFGILDFDWNRGFVSLQVRDIHGKVRIAQTLDFI